MEPTKNNIYYYIGEIRGILGKPRDYWEVPFLGSLRGSGELCASVSAQVASKCGGSVEYASFSFLKEGGLGFRV